MKHQASWMVPCILLIGVLACRADQTALPRDGDSLFSVTLDPVENGTLEVFPPVPEGGRVPAGSVLTLQAAPDPGYVIDSVYHSFSGYKGWMQYAESMQPVFDVVVDQDMRIGASFIQESELEGFRVIQDVVYAKPGVKPLKYDVYVPDGARQLPCVVIIHGGGWSANNEDIMRGLARELVRSGDYVVFSIDYRWLNKRDGDETPNTMVDLIEDVFGAIAHIQEHVGDYGADPGRIAVTGDSAGGHLSAAAANMAGMIGDGGFGEQEDVFQYRPTYMPEGKSIEQVREKIAAAIRAAAPSYGVFDGLEGMSAGRSDAWRRAICPIETIPDAKDRPVPQFLLRGTKDWIKDADVQAYADALRAAGQRVEYVQVEGARHAFLDWKPDPDTKATFRKYGVPAAAKMKAFFDTVFYAEPETKMDAALYDTYGGLMTIHSEATGYFRLEEINGRHFLITPDGHGYRALGINHFHKMTSTDYDGAIRNIKRWGFNAGCYQGPNWMWQRCPYTKGINLVPVCQWKPDSQFSFKDVFDPAVLSEMEEMIRDIVQPQRENKMLIGYFLTDIPLWTRSRNGQSWITFYKALPPDSAGGRVWFEWRRDHPNADEQEFLAVIARQLYSKGHEFIHKYDTNHLIFGDRYHEQVDMPEIVVREALPYIDAISIQPTVREFDAAAFDALYKKYGKPIYIADHVSSFATKEHPVTMGQAASDPDSYVAYYTRYVTSALSHPAVIGFNKCQYQDEIAPSGMLKQGLLQKNEQPYSTVDGIKAANSKALQAAYSMDGME